MVRYQAGPASFGGGPIASIPRVDAVVGARGAPAHASKHMRGLLLDGERKTITPISKLAPGSDVQALWPVRHSESVGVGAAASGAADVAGAVPSLPI